MKLGITEHLVNFSDEFVGEGTDQEGPGIYFTNNYEDAWGYAKRKRVISARLNFNKIVPLKGRIPVEQIKKLITWTDDLDEKLSNWDEDKRKAMQMAVRGSTLQDGPFEAFKQVWYDFYRYNPVEYVRNMVLLGYDGTIVQRQFMNVKHAIVYNIKIIEIINI
jgi:hypothetical protein